MRILLVPLLVIFLIEGKNQYAFWVFVVAGVSDALDGFLARVLKQKTALGAFVDPIADKLLLAASYITMAVLGLLPEWLTVVVVSRDVIILTGIGILLMNNRPLDFKPTIDSKITTLLQLVTVFYFLGYEYITRYFVVELGQALIYGTAVVTIFSGARYVFIGFRILGKAADASSNQANSQ